MIKQTLKVYQLAMALSERDPASSAATTFETMQEALQQTGLANIFKLFWDKLCTILSTSLLKVSSSYAYLFNSLSSRYTTFLQSIKVFWEQVLSNVQPNEKIKLVELKNPLFDSLEPLRQRYFEHFILK